MTGPGHEDHVEIVTLDHAVQMRPHERESGARAPVTEQALLDVLGFERLAQERIVNEKDHARGKVVARAPPRIDESKFVALEDRLLRCIASGVLAHYDVSIQ